MSLKRTIRAINAASRAAERESSRRRKELERKRKQYEKMQELEQAEYEVEVYENHIEVIQSIHKECSSRINWLKISKSKMPEEPIKRDDNERRASLNFTSYKPSIIDRIFKLQEKRLINLKNKIDLAKKIDEEVYKENMNEWRENVRDWSEEIDAANALLSGNVGKKLDIIQELDIFSEINHLGSNISISVLENGILDVEVQIHGDDIIPRESKSLLKSGKLSVKEIPIGKFNEIYQDYVCSCVMRVANEIFSAIPDQVVLVSAMDALVDKKTGHLKNVPILSVLASRDTFDKLNLDSLDPSSAMKNFIHNMSFKKLTGFDPSSKVDLKTLEHKLTTV